jgi:glycosyltransferase involved in cell wall biosynthesis
MRVCMVAYSFYDMDNRVRRYAEALAQQGAHVEAISLRQHGQSREEAVSGVHVSRIQLRTINEKGKLSYLLKILAFLIKSSAVISARHLRRPYDLVHVHSVPDYEVFAAWLPKLTGCKVILDIHDLVPEFYASKFAVSSNSPLTRSLKLVERLSCGFADHVIASNPIWRETLVARSTQPEKCTTFLNYPDGNIFRQPELRRKDGKFIMLYPGTLNHHQGLDIAISAFASIKDQVPQAEFHIYGNGPEQESLRRQIKEMKLEDRVILRDRIPLHEIAKVMANADLGIVPKRNDSFGGEAFSTKIFEFMLLGVPVVVSETKIDRQLFDPSLVSFFPSEDVAALADRMLTLIRNKQLREQMTANASRFIEDFRWEEKKRDYLSLVNQLQLGAATPEKVADKTA